MLGALIVAFVIVVVLPVSLMMSGAVVSAVMGWALNDERDDAD